MEASTVTYRVETDATQLKKDLAGLTRSQLYAAYCCAGCDANNMVERFEIERGSNYLKIGLRLKSWVIESCR